MVKQNLNLLSKSTQVETKLLPNKDGTYTVVYVPLTAGIYTLRLKYGEKVLANLPSKVIVDPAVYKSQVKLCGNGADRKGGSNATCQIYAPLHAKIHFHSA